MKLSERDRKLLLILVIVIIVCVPYFFIIQPLMDKVDSLGKEISDLNAQVKYREELALMEESTEKQRSRWQRWRRSCFQNSRLICLRRQVSYLSTTLSR